MTKTGCGKRRCGEDEGVGDRDTGRGRSGSGGSGDRGGDFDGDGSGVGSDRSVDKEKTGGEDKVGGVYGRTTETSNDRVDICCTGGYSSVLMTLSLLNDALSCHARRILP